MYLLSLLYCSSSKRKSNGNALVSDSDEQRCGAHQFICLVVVVVVVHRCGLTFTPFLDATPYVDDALKKKKSTRLEGLRDVKEIQKRRGEKRM